MWFSVRDVEEWLVDRPARSSVRSWGVLAMLFRAEKKTGGESRDTQRQMSELLDTLPGLWASFDPDGRVILVNEKGLELMGHGREWWSSSIFSDLYPESEAERIVGKALKHALSVGQWSGEATLETATDRLSTDQKILAHGSKGGARPFSLLATPVEDDRTRARDVALRNRRENVVAMSLGIVHDMNNFLAPITAYANLLASGPLMDVRAQAYLAEIETAARRGRALATRLLDLSKDRPIESTMVDMVEIATEVCHSLRMSRPDLTVELYSDATRSTVHGDPIQLHQLVMNLGRNATEALAARPGRVEIRLRNIDAGDGQCGAENALGCLEITVGDDGPGMSAGDTERAFDAFFTSRPEGSGLGLSLARDIAEAHGGTAILEPRAPHGTTARVLLPSA